MGQQIYLEQISFVQWPYYNGEDFKAWFTQEREHNRS